MQREVYRNHTEPKKKNRTKHAPKKITPVVTPPEHPTFFNITQEQKHGRGPRR